MQEKFRTLDAEPEFAAALPRRAVAVTPRELFCGLFIEPESSPEYLEPAFRFLQQALSAAPAVVSLKRGSYAERFLELVARAHAEIEPLDATDFGSSWPVRVVREFAAVGLSEGVWLSPGLLRLEGEQAGERAELLRAQVLLRARGARALQSVGQLYGALLGSLGIPVQAVSRWDFEESAVCADVSYEHALLGLALAAFPERFSLEIVGFNLWAAAVGPCPLLAGLKDELAWRGAALRYFEAEERAHLKPLAIRFAELSCVEGEPAFARIVAGFSAAHASYRRWEAAMREGNVPYTPREFVLEGIRRKARFAIDHHHDVQLKGRNLAELLKGGEEAHTILLDHLAETASLVRKGAPDRSPFMTHTLSLDGPMFDAFTADEKNDLREWIASLAHAEQGPRPRRRVELAGRYVPSVEREPFLAHLAQRFGALSQDQLSAYLSAPESQPGIAVFSRGYAQQKMSALQRAFEQDPRLAGEPRPAPYAEGSLVALTKFSASAARSERTSAGQPNRRARGLLRGCADVVRSGPEELGLLLTRYLAEASDFSGAADPALARLPVWQLLCDALALNLHVFVPEILGINLALDLLEDAASGEAAKGAPATFAIHAFLGRVQESAPEQKDAQWQRIFWALRATTLLARGSVEQRAALYEALTRAAGDDGTREAVDESVCRS